MIAKLLVVLIFLFTFETLAACQLGTGFNSATGGRLVPSINLGVGSSSFEVIFSSTGVSTPAYYHSAYKVAGYWTWKAGDFLIGDIDAGFGAGALYAVRSFADTGAQFETKSDYVLGPAFFVRWSFLGPVFLAVDSLYGVVGPSNRFLDIVSLNARDNVNFMIGIRL